MQGIGLTGIGLQNLFVDRLRLAQLSPLVQTNGPTHLFGHIYGGCRLFHFLSHRGNGRINLSLGGVFGAGQAPSGDANHRSREFSRLGGACR